MSALRPRKWAPMPRPGGNETATAAIAGVDAPQMWANRRNSDLMAARSPPTRKEAVAAPVPGLYPIPASILIKMDDEG